MLLILAVDLESVEEVDFSVAAIEFHMLVFISSLSSLFQK